MRIFLSLLAAVLVGGCSSGPTTCQIDHTGWQECADWSSKSGSELQAWCTSQGGTIVKECAGETTANEYSHCIAVGVGDDLVFYNVTDKQGLDAAKGNCPAGLSYYVYTN